MLGGMFAPLHIQTPQKVQSQAGDRDPLASVCCLAARLAGKIIKTENSHEP